MPSQLLVNSRQGNRSFPVTNLSHNDFRAALFPLPPDKSARHPQNSAGNGEPMGLRPAPRTTCRPSLARIGFSASGNQGFATERSDDCMARECDTDSHRDFTILVTAHQAYPAFERLCLSARSEIVMGFRVFDPWTRLRSTQAREIGHSWLDLIEHLLRRGVRIELTIADFDPVARPDAHRATWASIRAVHAAGILSGRPELLHARAAMHPARLGLVPRLLLWPRALVELSRTAGRLNAMSAPRRETYLREAPRLRAMLRDRNGRLSARAWPIPDLTPATHHHKLAVIDGEAVYIGGLDLNERRYDSPEHDCEPEDTWHDVQLCLRGPVAHEARQHLQSYETIARGAPGPHLPGLLRTISCKCSRPLLRMSPQPHLTEIADAHGDGATNAQRLIYLETQYFRDTRFARHLARLGRGNPGLGLILILPGAPEEVAFVNNPSIDSRYGEYLQAKCVDLVTRAFGDRAFVGSPAQTRRARSDGRHTLYDAPIIYVHSKVSIFDTDLAIVSSANLNGRSFRWDTEVGLSISDPARVRDLWMMCAGQWLGPQVPDACLAPETAVAAWRSRAQENARSDPSNRAGFLLPYASRPARRFGHTLPGIPEEMV